VPVRVRQPRLLHSKQKNDYCRHRNR